MLFGRKPCCRCARTQEVWVVLRGLSCLLSWVLLPKVPIESRTSRVSSHQVPPPPLRKRGLSDLCPAQWDDLPGHVSPQRLATAYAGHFIGSEALPRAEQLSHMSVLCAGANRVVCAAVRGPSRQRGQQLVGAFIVMVSVSAHIRIPPFQ